MLLPGEQIKQAILHREPPVRSLALRYFSQSFSGDTTVMPLVVEAVERFGREASVLIVGEAENLPQSESTMQWCMEELRRDLGERNEDLDDYRYVLSKVLASADPSLHTAIASRQPAAGLIHHTDRGGQYAGKTYRGVLRRAGMTQSMSGADNCYDNAFQESCFGTIKTELELDEYEDAAQAVGELSSYTTYYNVDRRHSSLDYLTPAEFETQQISQK